MSDEKKDCEPLFCEHDMQRQWVDGVEVGRKTLPEKLASETKEVVDRGNKALYELRRIACNTGPKPDYTVDPLVTDIRCAFVDSVDRWRVPATDNATNEGMTDESVIEWATGWVTDGNPQTIAKAIRDKAAKYEETKIYTTKPVRPDDWDHGYVAGLEAAAGIVENKDACRPNIVEEIITWMLHELKEDDRAPCTLPRTPGGTGYAHNGFGLDLRDLADEIRKRFGNGR